jgi:FMN phosphatase YigB (HAD superfamily)
MKQIKAIFFDLDGTLLGNDMAVFLPHYFQLLAARVADILPSKDFIRQLLDATAVMQANDGRATNQEVFAEAFFPLAGHSRDALEPVFLDFYQQDFPALQQYTTRKPAARQVVQAAFDRGYAVAVTTNPLFPEIAIHHRLAWAGVDDFPYDLVTTYENSRACKPNLRYFEEVAQKLGHDPQACLMVGDENMDMVAAHIGCPTFLVPGPATALAADTPEPTYRGTLSDILSLL